MKLRKVLALAAAAVMAVAALASCGVKEDSSNDSKAGGSSEKHYRIGIVQIMEHTSLNTIRDAVIDRLAELGYVDGKRKNLEKNCTFAFINMTIYGIETYPYGRLASGPGLFRLRPGISGRDISRDGWMIAGEVGAVLAGLR